MNTTKRTRRVVAALAVPALLFTAACGSDSDDKPAGSQVKVAGEFGEKPKITVADDAEAADEAVVETVSKGKGKKVEEGDFVRLDFTGQLMAKDGQNLGGTWDAPPQQPGQEDEEEKDDQERRQLVHQLGQPSQELPESVLNAVVGQTSGSRITIEGTAEALIGEQLNPEAGISADDGLLWVVDVVGAESVGAQTAVKGEQAKPEDGMPEVEFNDKKAASITVPKGEKPPKELKEQVLIKGSGAEVKAGDGLIAQYTGVKWEDGEKFDASWDNNGATAFQIGTGTVVPGWDQGLVGKKVGDRVELVIPPKLAYGASGEHELAKNTLVFVVDIIGKV